ncbi:unnamed protein product (macronuclear) [Paramecium tetraurelia]|uniref:Katanin p80 subunit C-terminal domain-containing protein n=1 Tax=Paramecium tetraurelia TaxID=5888 RepID=A0CLS8_PARTE|nr:uncharacterized protein GSPATT00038670001 [Paramecium tetraurelia]CAK71745.1 unnamed protein product [Paramecium tetraurelia]|eukprot:XP_001439142.1 hypothetical protein (macronuclear) [Paramecium tetraurelia strain d4-2]
MHSIKMLIFEIYDWQTQISNQGALRTLMIKLQKLWSVERVENMMRQINLCILVETPYMMEIIVQVLPKMMESL